MRVLLHKFCNVQPEDADIDLIFPNKAEKGDGVEASLPEVAQLFGELEAAVASHEAAVAQESSQADACRQKAKYVHGVFAATRSAEEAVAAHESAQARLRKRSNRFGALLIRKGKPASAVAASMVAEGAVDKKAFRRRCEADPDLTGWGDGELDKLFEQLRTRLGEATAATLDEEALQRAFSLMCDEASAARQAVRDRDIDVIETSKAVTAAQAEYSRSVQAWEQEAALEADRLERARQAQAEAEDRRSRLRRSRTQRLSQDSSQRLPPAGEVEVS